MWKAAYNYSIRSNRHPRAISTSPKPNDALRLELIGDREKLAAAGILSVQAIGDGDVPSTIAAAVYDGHRAARELDADIDPDLPFRREHIHLEEAN